MGKAVKFAVSILDSEFKELETLRKKKGLTRSGFIRETIKALEGSKRKRKDLSESIRRDTKGFQKILQL